MLSGGAQREPNTPNLNRDNGDRKDHLPTRSKSGIPRYHKPPSERDPSHRYQDQDKYPLHRKVWPLVTESQHAPVTKGANIPSKDQNTGEGPHGSDPAAITTPSIPPGPWAGFRSEEEL